ncbi:fused DSP-PTPase phosphatase/NAD kinase-like protein [Mesoterricola silvestris]|uniref:Tyrosine specific protein phosphatases domain-containing protein n=1 Tax=Mesoterricola silvestris TaxID=2927979 RepID=A0AA48GL20_9BACT|nr:tyrosine-protein phosphatase [Mesoterricola silvestris]BDU73194.1 hypothetical protein METEAL_23680 [Mesoterricola silvestris]
MPLHTLIPRALLPVLLLGLPVAAQAPERPASQGAATPSDTEVPGVANFARLSPAVWRGAQPTAEGFRNLEKWGVRTVISFRHDHDDFQELKGTGLKYLRIPSLAFDPSLENIARFLKVVEDEANWPVFIHCAKGKDRTGYNAAAYRIVIQGWTPARALEEMHAFRFNRIWVLNPGFVRRLTAEELRARVDREPPPLFQIWVP